MTAPGVTPCLWLDGNVAEAVAFWTGLVPGSRITDERRLGGEVLTIAFELGDRPFLALNGMGTQHAFTEAMSLILACETQGEIDRVWDRILADGGAVIQCGWIKDRFGLTWQVMPRELPDLIAGDGERAARVIAALRPMMKVDLAALRAAADG
jgi:predicted 3-demethylubiquinone-9 3-methyltransferase (glyoxalase superfamily)